MYEQTRQQYLDALGVQTYMPKWILPSAPLPVQCDLAAVRQVALAVERQPKLPLSVVSAQSETSSDSAQTSESVEGLLQSMLLTRKSTDIAKPTAALTGLSLLAKQQLQANVHSFALNLWQCTGLIVVADRQVEKALPVSVLLNNILVALGRSLHDTQKAEIIKWPLENLSAVQAGPADAYLKSILSARRLAGQETTLLCFGEQSCVNFLGQDVALYTQQEVALTDKAPLPALGLPSLETLIETPSLKAQVWNAISYLRLM